MVVVRIVEDRRVGVAVADRTEVGDAGVVEIRHRRAAGAGDAGIPRPDPESQARILQSASLMWVKKN